MNMDISAWRSEQHEGYVYVVQVNDIKHGDKSLLHRLFENWKTISEGWNIKNNSKILIMKKRFSCEKEWHEWAKNCPIKVVEYKYRAGKEKIVQLSCKTRKKRVSNAKK